MSGSFVCNTCNYSFACEELLIAHNRTHVKEEKNSAYDEFEVSIPRTSISEIKSQSSIRVKEEPCSSVQSASQVSTSGISISDPFSQNSSRGKEHHVDITNNIMQQSNTTSAERNPPKFFVCDKCHKSFEYQNSLTDHYRMHIKLQAAAKNICFENYYTYSKMQGNRSCDICDMSFENKGERKKHFYAVHGKSNRCCDECGQRYNRLEKLLRHTRRFHEEKLVRCDVCSKGFLRNKDLKHHYRIHVGKNTRGWYMEKSEPLIVKKDPVLAKEEPMLCKSEVIEE